MSAQNTAAEGNQPLTPLEPAPAANGGPLGVVRGYLGGAAGRNIGLFVVLLVIFIIGAVTIGENFLSADNALTIVRYATVTGVVSIGMTFVIILGGIDLSVGSVLGLSSVLATMAFVQAPAQAFWPLIIVVSSEIEEVLGLSDRVLVIADGEVLRTVNANEIDESGVLDLVMKGSAA